VDLHGIRDRAQARQTAQEILCGAPDGTARDRVLEVAIDGRDPSLEPPDVIHWTAPNVAHRVLQPIPLGGQHAQQPAPARHQRVRLLGDRVGERGHITPPRTRAAP
jgi:hypothetical protein